MKIAMLVNEFPPKKVGGVGISTYNTALFLSKRGHEIHVLTVLEGELPENSIEERFHVHRITWKKVKVLGNLLFSAEIIKKLKEVNPDIVHIQGLWIGIPGYLAKKILHIPYVVTGHGSDIYLQSRLLLNLRSKPVLRSADARIALTDDMRKKIKNICKRDAFVVPNGINLEVFGNSIKLRNIKKEQKILFVGSLVPVKGVRYLIESMKAIKNNYSNVKLVIIGDGTEKHELEKLVIEFGLSDCVSFVGKVSNHKISQYMIESDIFVLPSLSEGFGIVLLEAMASGLPIIASNVGGIPSLIQNGVNGFLVEPGNPEKIAEKILFLFNDRETMIKISEGNKKAVEKYDWEKIAVQLEDIYLKCII
jgi:glycosyltransferase involved in cell wall biosynthesis